MKSGECEHIEGIKIRVRVEVLIVAFMIKGVCQKIEYDLWK